MTTAVTQTTNFVPVQGVFAPEPTYALQYFVGPAGTPFYGPANATFTNISTVTGTITTTPTSDTDIANKGYVDSVAQGLDVKASCVYSTTANITLSGLGTQAGGDWASSLTVGDRVLVKNQTSSQFNGIYVAASSTWARSKDMDVWAEVPSAFTFIESGTTLADTGWVTTANAGGTIDVTAMPWSQFSGAGSYLAGTGLTLTGNTFSITSTTVTAAAYGSASSVGTFTVNAQGQLTLAASTSIAIAGTQITSGTIDSARLSGSYSGITGLGTLGSLTVTNTITGSVSGSAATATSATNIAGGTVGAVVYQSGSGATAFLSAGTNGKVLTLASGIPSWATPTVGTVTSIAQTFTGGIISVAGSPITTNGTLALTVAGTSGGIPYFASGTTWATSALLAANALMVGGGAGVAPSTVTTGTGVVTALGVNIGTAGAFVVNGGALGTPSSGTVTNLTGTAAINITGTATNLAGGAAASIPYQSATGTTAFLASTAGDANKVLQSNGTSAPSWVIPTAYATVTDDTTTNAVRYPLFANQTTGNLTTNYVSSTKYNFNPSTGLLTATGFSGSGASLTSLPAGQLSGTIPTGVLGNSSLYIGTTSIALNRSSSAQSLTGVNIDGSAGSATTATNATNATNVATTDNTTSATTWYPAILTSTTGNNPVTVSSTKLSFVPSTGVLSATSFTGAGTGLTGTATSLSIGGNAATATSAAKWTTARNLAGNSVDGSAAVAFANKFIVQGTTDTGLSGAQFLGALGTGIVKNTTTTGVLSIAVAADFPTLNQNTSGTASNVTGTVAVANGGTGLTTAPTNGQIDIGSTGVGFVRNTLTAGTGISIGNAAGAITITNTSPSSGGTVTSVAALTLGTTGTDLSSTVATGTTTPVITLQVPTASATNRGALSAADWTTFNNKGLGTVTSASVVSANGFAGTVATATTTPAITISTSITGVLKGNGTAISAATVGTDYSVGTSALTTGILKSTTTTGALSIAVAADFPTLNQNTIGSAATLTTGRTIAITGDLAYTSPSFDGSTNVTAAGTLATVNANVGSFTNATFTVNGKGLITAASSGTAPVTSVTATSPVASTGGATPVISMPAATTSVSGYLTSTDWTTFNNKGSGTVTSVTATSPVASTGGTTPVISMPAATTLVSGYLTSTDWATFNSKGSGTVTSVGQTFTGGIISIAGSPVTTSGTLALTVAGTSGGIPYFTSATGWATSAALAANAIVLGGGAGVAPATTTTGTGVVTALGVNTGTAGAFVVNGGALGTPSSGTVTNLTGTASININGTVGATTANSGAFTTVSATGVITSTVLTGTAPLTVASTTQVANLNAATSGTATNATNTAITDDTTTAAEMYLSWVTANTGNLPQKVTSTKLKFNPSTGVLTATGGVTGGTF